MDFKRFFDAFEVQSHNVAVLAQKVDDLRLSNLQLLQAVRRAERLPRVLDPESKKLAVRLKEQALAHEREQLRQQRARKLQQIEREMAAAKASAAVSAPRRRPAPAESRAPPHMDLGALSRTMSGGRSGPPEPASQGVGGGASTSLSTEDELNSTVIAKDRLDLFRQVAGGGTTRLEQPAGVTSSLLDQVNLESPSAVTNGHEESLGEYPEDALQVPQLEDVSVYGANTTTGTGFYTTSTDILQYMRHSTNTITSMFTLQEEEEEELSSRRQTPAPPAERPNPQPRAVNGERQHLTRYLIEASLPDDESEAVPSHGPATIDLNDRRSEGRPWDVLMDEQFEAQEELGLKLQAEIHAQEERLREQMYLLTKMRNNNNVSRNTASPPPLAPSAMSQASLTSRHTPHPPVIRSDDDVLAATSASAPKRLPTAEELPPVLQAKFCRVSAAAKGFLVRRLYQSDRAQAILKTIKDTAECALSLSESTDTGGAVVSRRQDAFLHSRLVNQLQASLYEFHDLFFTSTPGQRMAVIRATRRAREERERLRHSEQLEAISEDAEELPLPQEKKPARLSAATLRRMAMREKGQLHNVVQPRFVKKPHDSSGEDSPRPATAPAHPSVPRAQLRVLRPLQPHPQPHPPSQPAPKPRCGNVQRSRSLHAAGKAPPTAATGTRPATAPPVTRSQNPPRRRQTAARPVHVVTVKEAGRRVTRKVRAAPAEDLS